MNLFLLKNEAKKKRMWNFTVELDEPVHIAGFTIGLIGAVLLIIYNISYICKIKRHKRGNIVSLSSLVCQYALQLVMLTYGTLEQQVPFMAANVGALCVLITLTVYRHIYWGEDPENESEGESESEICRIDLHQKETDIQTIQK